VSDESRNGNRTTQRLILLAVFALAGAAWYAAIVWTPATWQLIERGYRPLSMGTFRTRASCEAVREWVAAVFEASRENMACVE
jgi:hypothetical protein